MEPLPLDPEVQECLSLFSRLRPILPGLGLPEDTFLVEWAIFKRRAASVAAECMARLLPKAVKAVYYVELSDSHVGRDVDLLVDLRDDVKGIDPVEVEETIESLLTRLARMAGINFRAYTTSPSLFEVHTTLRGIYGSRAAPGRVIRLFDDSKLER